MLELILVIMVTILVTGLCLHHNTMTKQLKQTTEQDGRLIRRAAEHSIMASNTVNAIIALTEVTKAVQIIETLHDRYGPETASQVGRIDTQELLEVLQDQKDRVSRDVMQQHPTYLPPHPLNHHVGFTKHDSEDDE